MGEGDSDGAGRTGTVLGYEGTTSPGRAGMWRPAGWCIVGQLVTIVVFNLFRGYLWMLLARPSGLIQLAEHSAVMGLAFVGAFSLARPKAPRSPWIVDAVALGNGIAIVVLWIVIWRVFPIGPLYSLAIRLASLAHVPFFVIDPLVILPYAFCVCLVVWAAFRAAVDRRER